MALSHKEIKQMIDEDYLGGYDTRLKASDDRVFYFITQIDDWLVNNSQLGYLGEFNLLRKAGRQIISDLASNPVQLDFEPVETDREDGAELLDGMYRTDDNNNLSIEAYDSAKLDAVVCGVGAWEIYTEYSSRRNSSEVQVIRRRPLMEAVNTVFWDANAVLLDKSDATRVCSLVAYTEDGYRAYIAEVTGQEPEDVELSPAGEPEHSHALPWCGTGSAGHYYITNFYHTQKIQTKLITLRDPLGEEREFLSGQLVDVVDELTAEGWTEIGSKDIVRWETRKYIVSGSEILNGEMGRSEDGETDERQGEVIAGEYLPIIPCYGEHTVVEGQEHYEGFVRLAKDPARLRDFIFNYLADIVSKSARKKPVYSQEQIAGFEHMYAETGADDNFPYRLANIIDHKGEPLPHGPLNTGEMEPTIPTALAALFPLTREAVEDVAPSMLPKEISDPSVQIAAKTVKSLQASISEQSTVYQHNFTIAKRRDGVVYASIAAEIKDIPQKVMLTLPDGTRKQAELMSTVFDEETQKEIIINDLSNSEFRVTAKIGPAYSSQKEQTVEKMTLLLQAMVQGSPEHKMMLLQIMTLSDGIDTDDIREYARKELILMGVKKPDTPEEKAMFEKAQNQPKEPDAAMVLAQGEMLKGKAAMELNQLKMMQMKGDFQTDQKEVIVKEFEAATKRILAQVKAEEAGAIINYKRVDTAGKEIDNVAKMQELKALSVLDMDDDALFEQMRG